jgi:GTP-binding protein
MSAPLVAIIGRPNVGKSTFFNRVIGARQAVVHDRPGITRDRHTVRADWAGRSFMLVDTGGFLPTAAQGRDALVRRQAEMAIDMAHAVVFMTDAKTGVTDLDRAIAQSLRRRSAKALLVVNKVDKPGDPVVHEFHRLGLGEPQPISSENGFGIGDLLDRVIAALPAHTEPEPQSAGRIAIIGRPNVGKSSITNALLGEERMVVEPVAGTTMDAIDSPWETPSGTFTLIDTAGIRRQSHYDDDPEFFATLRALAALERSDLACIVVDATHGFLGQEARLVGNAFDAGASVLLLYNKWDLVEDRDVAWKRLAADRKRRYPTLGSLPAMALSATAGTHVGRLPKLIRERVDAHRRKVPTARLNRWLVDVQRRRQVPSNRAGYAPRLYYVTQTGKAPPQFTLFVNAPSKLSESYRRFLWLDLVDTLDFDGVPVRLRVRKSE